jgi:threonine aldolase
MSDSATPFSRPQFTSDNYSGICPEAYEGMAQANAGYSRAYGDDPWTQAASDKLRELFETDCEVFFVFNGTAANSMALAALCQSYHSVICHEVAHIETDECGGPEFYSNGTKILTVPGTDGKMDPRAVEATITRRNDIHYPKPRALSLTEPTEVGTLYTVKELNVLKDIADRYGLNVHMDGARFANAVESMNVRPADITWKAGVDVLCFGGTKNGMAVGEAVVFFNRILAHEFDYRCKQAGQLASKMRFISAPWIKMLETGAWLRNAGKANRSARLLCERLRGVPGVEIMHPCEVNSVFVKMPPPVIAALRSLGWHFYDFIGDGNIRLMCSWSTGESDIESFVSDVRTEMGRLT